MLDKHEISSALPPDRSFGGLFTGVFAAVAAWLWWKALPGAPALIILALAFLAASLFFPRVLHPLNVAWMAFGALLHRIVSPVVLGAIYFGVFAPVAFVLRLRGRDALRLRRDSAATSYWLTRDPPGPPSGSFNNQF
jgi:hypothetical protein